MNPFNKLWIGMVWMLVLLALVGTYAGDMRDLAPCAVVFLAFLITGETIGIDRVEREFVPPWDES